MRAGPNGAIRGVGRFSRPVLSHIGGLERIHGEGRNVSDAQRYEEFVAGCRRRLWLAVVPIAGPTVAEDAVAEALTWAWENWDRVQTLENPHGYLYRIAQRWAARQRRDPVLPTPAVGELPEVEPGLIEALALLSEQQRTVVWLVEGCGWSLTEASRFLDVSVSSVRTHLARALDRLRSELEVDLDDQR
jgi:DNA-directed RNA polymerase specialized sigma24 family protein